MSRKCATSLRGKEIGLYFAHLSKMNRETRELSCSYNSNSNNNSSLMDRRTKKHPPGLKGKEIGLYYAQKGKGKSKEQKQKLVEDPSINFNFNERTKLNSLLEQVCGVPTYKSDSPRMSKYLNAAFIKFRRNSDLDSLLLKELKNKQLSNKQFQNLLSFRKTLPAFNMQNEIINLIANNQVVVLSGLTGCGKTTQVPQFVLDYCIQELQGSVTKIVVTQPRRISAITVAERVAAERGEILRDSVGYQIRLEKELPKMCGSILFCTTGIVLKWLESNPLLEGVSHLILDEVHERDLEIDVLMAIVQNILKSRPQLKLILMSATLNAEKLSEYFGNCPMIDIPGRLHPVQSYLLEDAVEMSGYYMENEDIDKLKKSTQHYIADKSVNDGGIQNQVDADIDIKREILNFIRSPVMRSYSQNTRNCVQAIAFASPPLSLIAHMITYIHTSKPEGAILVFVPGISDIRTVMKMVKTNPLCSQCDVHPLHSSIDLHNQRQVFNRPASGRRKVIVATNIAETSITVDDVVYVIDSGFIKLSGYDAAKMVDSLGAVRVSAANAKQREGRAGRVKPGICFHLYPQLVEQRQEEFLPPTALRTRLEALILQVKLLKLGDVTQFICQMLDHPPETNVRHAVQFLQKIGALTAEQELTYLGEHLARLPLECQPAKLLLLGTMFSCLDPVLTIAAGIDGLDVFQPPFDLKLEKDFLNRKKYFAGDFNSDHIAMYNAFQQWSKNSDMPTFAFNNYLSHKNLCMIKSIKKQLAEMLNEMGYLHTTNPYKPEYNRNSSNMHLVVALLGASFFPNLVCVPPNHKNRISKINPRPGGASCQLFYSSVNMKAEADTSRNSWLAYYTKKLLNAEPDAYVFDTTRLSPISLFFFAENTTFVCKRDSDEGHVLINDWIKIRMSREDYSLLTRLRFHLDQVFSKRVVAPNFLDWSVNSPDNLVLKAVVDILTVPQSTR